MSRPRSSAAACRSPRLPFVPTQPSRQSERSRPGPDLRVGAGTIIDAGLVDQAAAAGATFIVTPGFSAPVVERYLEIGIPVIPGVGGATDIMSALSYGLTLLKFFPAESLGRPDRKGTLSPIPRVRFVPTGGVTATTAPTYLRIDSVAAVGGSWITPPAAITGRRFEEIELLAAEAVAICTETER